MNRLPISVFIFYIASEYYWLRAFFVCFLYNNINIYYEVDLLVALEFVRIGISGCGHTYVYACLSTGMYVHLYRCMCACYRNIFNLLHNPVSWGYRIH